MSNLSKIVLGTVQFGREYGINSTGRPTVEEVSRILKVAAEAGITMLDTSSAYGEAEIILGRCMPPNVPFQIISKYPNTTRSVRDTCFTSMQHLNVDKLYGYLVHNFENYRDNNSIWEDFCKLRQDDIVKKVGFSIYTESELDFLLENNVDFDMIQIPRNLLDRKFDTYLPALHQRGVEVHVRSTFLQGLFFMNRENLPHKLKPLQKYLNQLDEYSKVHNMSISDLALNYNLQNDAISGVLIGVDSVSQLEENITNTSIKKIGIDIEVTEKELLNPINWK